MLSGSGRTLVNLCASIGRSELDAEIAVVIASRECLGAERARERGFATLVMPGVIAQAPLLAALCAHRVDWVILAGYLKKVDIPPVYRGRVVNIHPALLPDFGGPGMYGDRVHAAVLAAGVAHTGCTVHLCDNEYDQGSIVLQRTCPVLPGDEPHTLAARVFQEEIRAYPEALGLLFQRAGIGEIPHA